MKDLIPIHEIVEIKRKESKTKEFFINFFEKCNLSCGFCWQNHDDDTGMDRQSIVGKAYTIIKNQSHDSLNQINVMGGELFMDTISDETLEAYLEFSKIIKQNISGNYEINFITNMVFNNTSRFIKFLDKLHTLDINFNIGSSYDPLSRFNKKTKETFFDNIKLFRDYIKTISVVMTKQNIQYIHMNDDIVLDYIYANFSLYFDFYSPEKSAHIYRPSDKEVADFFIFLYNKYPNASPIDNYLNNTHNTTSCRASFIILPNNNTGSCRILAKKEDLRSQYNNQDIIDMEVRHINERGCLECNYFKQCGLGCFLHNDYIDQKNNECEYKRFFKVINNEE